MDDHHIDLFKAIASIETADEAQRFFSDLCTPAEIKAFIERWKVCQLLNLKKFSYRQINEMSGASLATIARVARFLNQEKNYGYKNMLEKLSSGD